MSHIFDALQRSEAEGDGSETAPARSAGYPPATELMQAAERKMQMRAAAAGVVSGTPSNGTDANGNGRHDHAAANSSELDQFPTLPVSILPSSRLVSVGAEESLGAEKFRFLAVKLRQLRQSRTLKKVLITSTIPQEGKSTVAANLACTLARRQRTLLLDGDTRRPALTRIFGLEGRPGLCDLLRGGSEATESIYHLEGPGFWMLPAGRVEGNPLELLQSGKLSKL